MAATEKQRLEFINRIRDEWGDRYAVAFMEMVPPLDWSQVATKADLERFATKDDLLQQTRTFVTWLLAIAGTQTALTALLFTLAS